MFTNMRVQILAVLFFVVLMIAWSELWTAFVYSLPEKGVAIAFGIMVGWILTTFAAALFPNWFTAPKRWRRLGFRLPGDELDGDMFPPPYPPYQPDSDRREGLERYDPFRPPSRSKRGPTR